MASDGHRHGRGHHDGGRLKRVREYVGDSTFCMTYGDCVADLDITALIEFHRANDAVSTLTAVQPPGRFGALSISAGGDKIGNFAEKPEGDGGWVNGGFFVLEPEALDYIDGDSTVWEREPLERMAAEERLLAYRHHGFWQPMDTLHDRMVLEEQWESGQPQWKLW